MILYKSKLVLENREYGVFSYDIIGIVNFPAIFDRINQKLDITEIKNIEISVKRENHIFNNAFKQFKEKHPLGKQKDQLLLLQQIKDSIQSIQFQLILIKI